MKSKRGRGNDNPGVIVMFGAAPGQYRQCVVIQGCTLNDYAAPLFDTYTTQYAVADPTCSAKAARTR